MHIQNWYNKRKIFLLQLIKVHNSTITKYLLDIEKLDNNYSTTSTNLSWKIKYNNVTDMQNITNLENTLTISTKTILSITYV